MTRNSLRVKIYNEKQQSQRPNINSADNNSEQNERIKFPLFSPVQYYQNITNDSIQKRNFIYQLIFAC